VAHVRAADPLLAPVIDHFGPCHRLVAAPAVAGAVGQVGAPAGVPAAGGGSSFVSLARAICGQQLSTKAAQTIYGRLCALMPEPPAGAREPSPAAVLAAAPEALRACGLSERKVSYLRDLAEWFASGRLSDAALLAMPDDELVAALTRVRGVGAWTVHMFAMFQLGRPDVLPTGDLGVRKGMAALYGLGGLPSPAEMERVSDPWRPFRSVGSYFMWRVASDEWREVAAAGGDGARRRGGKRKRA